MKKYFLLCWLLFVAWGYSYAQIEPQIRTFNKGIETLANPIPLAQRQQFLHQVLPEDPRHSLVLTKQFKDELGFEHEKYQEYFQGIKVEGATFTLHEKDRSIRLVSGELAEVGQLAIAPSFQAPQALTAALDYVDAERYIWQEAGSFGIPQQTEPTGELVILAHHRLGKDARLAYKFDVYASEPLYRAYVYVDAHSGEILQEDQRIHHANVNATGNSLYNGNVSFTADSYSGGFRLRQTADGGGIQTFDLNNSTNYGNATDVTSSSASFGSTNPTAVQAHWGAEQTHKYFAQLHNRNSYDGNGAVIRSYVSYSRNYVNAFWDGQRMTYGDGDGRNYGPLVSLDIVGHEIAHGVTQFSANLIYQNQSGALNESFSDIFGESIEYFATGSNDWLMGEDMGIGNRSGAIRSMSNPNAFRDPDTYLGTNWYTGSGDNGGVHINSGVQNKWFYILTEGENGTNDLGDSYNVTGIGIEKAAKIAYRNLAVYLGRNSQYDDARAGAIQSAIDLYGAGSPEVIATTNAWYAVGVGNPYGQAGYCTSRGNDFSYEWIAEVSIGSFTNTTGAAGYANYTNQTIALNAGQSYSVSLTPGFRNSSYNEYWKIWIDYNGDGDFADANELAFDGGALTNTVETGTLSIPASASGTTRLRVSMKYNAEQTPCEIFSYGEVEDYSVTFGSGPGPDAQAPTTPTGLTASNITTSTASLTWNASTDNVGVTGYEVLINGTSVGTVTSPAANLTNLTANTTYSVGVRAFDAAGNVSGTATTSFTTDGGQQQDTQAPTTPTGLTTANTTSTSTTLSWNASTDNVGVTGYEVFVNGSSLGTVTSTSANLTNLTPNTNYTLGVRAFDAAGNFSTTAITSLITPAPPTTNCISAFPYSESFESTNYGWTQATSDDFDWSRDASGTPSTFTGPSSASDGSYYMYTESSYPNYPSKAAILNSPCFDMSGLTEATFTFDYHMYGSSMGTLALQARIGSGNWATIWSLSGNQGNSWESASVDLADYVGNAAVNFRFSGLTSSSYRSDMTIDNIGISDSGTGDCPTLNFNDYSLFSYGGQDVGNNSIVLDNGATLYLADNTWKYINYPYTITPNTVIEFDFRSTAEGEIHGIAFDSDNSISSELTFRVFGTQNWGISNYDDYSGTSWVTYTIPVGQFYTGTADRLAFLADHDASPSNGNSYFRNVKIYEGVCNGFMGVIGTQVTPMAIFGDEPEVAFQVYPNPVTDLVHVSLQGYEEVPSAILTDLSGKQLWSGAIQGQVDIDMAAYPAGVYFLEVSLSSGQSYSEKIVKIE